MLILLGGEIVRVIFVLLAVVLFFSNYGSVLANATGDVNLDKRTNAIDALLILQQEARLIQLPYEVFACGDVNKDGRVNSIDAAIILGIILIPYEAVHHDRAASIFL